MVYPPYNNAVAIVPSDTVDFPKGLCDAIFVGATGTVNVVLQNNVAVSFTCQTGQLLPIKARRVNAAGTAATLLVALYRT